MLLRLILYLMKKQSMYIALFYDRIIVSKMYSFLRSTKKSFRNFCETTSLHGFRYIYSNTYYKKFNASLWICLCTFSTIFCIYLIYLQLQEYQARRIVTVIANAAYPIWNFPFPAVTVCGFTAVYRDGAAPFIKLL